jgi:diguanylate cyclase (GGDEF)-like protein/PAS domain S-box-containing protein
MFVLRVLAMFLPLALAVCAVTFYFYQAAKDNEVIGNRAREAVGIELGKGAISNALEGIRRDLRLVSEQHALKNFLDRSVPGEIGDFEQDMLNLSSSSRLYDQIRWLDETGMERVRVNFNGGNPVIVPVKERQNKHHRYYFADAFKLGRGEVYISPLDLNIEHDQIEIPPKPMLRMGTPVFDSHGDKRGIVVLNFFGVELLSRLGQATAAIADHAMLLNQDGYWLKSPRPDEEWGFMFGREQLTLAQRHPLAWRRIMQTDSGQFEDAEGLWTFKTIYPLLEGQPVQDGSATALAPSRDAQDARKFFWKAVARLPPDVLYAHTRAIRKPTAVALAALLGLLFAGCWKLMRARHRRNAAEAEVRLTNRNLERLVEERTAQLDADIAERKRTEQILRDREKLLSAILDNFPGFVSNIDQSLRFRFASRGHERMSGIPVKAITGRALPEIIGEEAFQRAKPQIQRALAGERVILENLLKNHDGSSFYAQVTLQPDIGEDGAVNGYFAFGVDITERKRTEEALRRAHDELEIRVQERTAELASANTSLRAEIAERKQAAEKHGNVIRTTMDGFWIADSHGRFLEVNDAYCRLIGYSPQELLTMHIQDVEAAETPEEIVQHIHKVIAAGHDRFETRHRCKDGRIVPIEVSVNFAQGDGGRFFVFLRDITERKQAEEVLRRVHDELEIRVQERTTELASANASLRAEIAERKRADERLRQAAAVFESACEGIIVTGADQRIQMVNPAFSELTGYTEAEVLGQTPELLRSGRHDRNFYTELWGSVNATGHWQGEIWNRRKNGEVYPELLSISAVKDQSGQITHYVGVFADISQLKATESQLEFLAHHDPLTRLPNRLLLLSRLEHGIEVARRENRQLALLMLDLDRFKDVNDSFGHVAGDELLQQVGERLTTRLRGVDTVSRLGGDEFTVLLEDIAHPEDAARVADTIIAALGEPWRLPQSGEVRIGVSVGISLFPQHGNTAAELLQHADAALYQAKAEGRGRFKYFSENLTRAARERIALEARLRRVIQEGELRVYYQPQVDIVTGRIVGAEALLRWQDPLEGLIQPCNFIPVAEATGLIGAIGAWVLRETCLQGVRWIEAGLPPLILAVNLSPHQFLHSDIAAVVASTLAETGFPAANLELELTESALMEREDAAVEILNRLRAIGVRLAIDDFGTGYSSLAYLKRFPLDVLKIDKSFVDDIPHSQDDMQIAATIVAMAHTLRLKVVAEGVETAEQLAFLRTQGCDLYQGYFISPPVPAEALEGLLREKSRPET